ncbi:MAG: thiamine pyrophosphate-binding protein [Candidatus Omnitrophota bacterium]|jgi:acetolactate synthase-1/2/3 large subunit
MKLSDYIVNFLVANKVTSVFEVCGGSITHLLDSLYRRKDIEVVSVHHEQAAAFAAEGYSRSSNKLGVAMATSGPGATNLITGIASCFFDSVPCLFITGQVNTYEFKFNKPLRQVGFQETDIVSMVKPVVKDSFIVTKPDKIKYYLEKAVYIATSGRPGPVLIDIPMNIQRSEINPNLISSFHPKKQPALTKGYNAALLAKILKLIKSSSRPVVLAGGGVRISGAEDELLRFIQKTGMPLVVSLLGLDSFAHDREDFIGMIGTYGNRCANLAVANSDLLLVLGSRLDSRQTGTKPETFARAAKVIRVDIDTKELAFCKVKTSLVVNCDIKKILSDLNKRGVGCNTDRIGPWRKVVRNYKDKYSIKRICNRGIDPNYFFKVLSEFIPARAIICADIGQNQMWAAQSLGIKKKQQFITQGGMGAMGSSLPLAIGAAFANPQRNIVAITGDGGFQLNIQELQTVYHYKLPIKIIMLNNRCYGMVRQFQEQYFNSRFQSTVAGYSCPDFQKVVNSYKISKGIVSEKQALNRTLRGLFAKNGPAFLEVDINREINVIPKLPVDRPIECQEPFLSQKELASSMLIETLEDKI